MASKNIAVYGIYADRAMVERAVEELKAEGFRNMDISVLFPETRGTKEFAVEKETKAPEGAATGAGTGAVLGGALGWLVGLGSLAIPGIGPFIAAGPIVSALAGVGAGGLVGGLAGALIGLGIPEYEAKRFEGRIKKGGILVSIHADDRDWKNKGKAILERTGAEDIGYKGESGADYDKTDKPYLKESEVEYDTTGRPHLKKADLASGKTGRVYAKESTDSVTSTMQRDARHVISASTVMRDKVVNERGEDLGRIEEIMIHIDSGRIAYAVLSFGGFLGMGDKLFAIPWQSLTLDEANKRFVLNIDKDRLETAPGFDKDHWPDMADQKWGKEIYNYYGYKPYW